MVKPGFLKSGEVVEWLGGIEPMWTHLEFASYCRLQRRPGEDDPAMQLATDLTEADAQSSPIVVAMLALLRMAGEKGGAKLTTGGGLTRAVITPIAEICDGPGYDLALIRSVTKVLNEADVWPAELLRHVATEMRLVRRVGRSLTLTAKGRATLEAVGSGGLMADLFRTVFWRVNLGHWDGYPVPTWPQSHNGIIFWSLAHAASTWENPERLARYATIPVIGVLEGKDDFAGHAFELRILRILAIFGLLDARKDGNSPNRLVSNRYYRKTQLYDSFFSFDITLEPTEIGARH
jgi:hypothetical protein